MGYLIAKFENSLGGHANILVGQALINAFFAPLIHGFLKWFDNITRSGQKYEHRTIVLPEI